MFKNNFSKILSIEKMDAPTLQTILIGLIRSGQVDLDSTSAKRVREMINNLYDTNLSQKEFKELYNQTDEDELRRTQEDVINIQKKLEKITKKYQDKIINKELLDPSKAQEKLFDDELISYDENLLNDYKKKLQAEVKNQKSDILKKKRQDEKNELLQKASQLGLQFIRKNASVQKLKQLIQDKEDEIELQQITQRFKKKKEEERKRKRIVKERMYRKLEKKEKKKEKREKKEQRVREIVRKKAEKNMNRIVEYHVTITIYYYLYQGNEPRYMTNTDTYVLSTTDDRFIDSFVQDTLETFNPGYEKNLDYYTVDSIVPIRQRDVNDIRNQALQGTVYTYYESFMDKNEQPEQNCVLEYLKKHFYKVAKKATNETFLQIMETTEDKVTLKHLEKIADKYRVSFNALNLDNKLIYHYDFKGMFGRFNTREEYEKFDKEHPFHDLETGEDVRAEFVPKNGHVDNMTFVVGNGHLYPITDKQIKKCIVERNKKNVHHQAPESNDEVVKNVVSKKEVVDRIDEELINNINPEESQVVISTKQSDLLIEALYLFKKDKMIYAISIEGKEVKSIKYKNTLLIANPEYNETNELNQKLNITENIISQNKTLLALNFFKNRITIPDCNLSHNLEEALTENSSSAWTEYFVSKPAEDCVSMDIAKCDTYNLIFNKHAILRNLEMIEDYNGEELEYGYYLLEKDTMYAGGAGWKSYILIQTLLDENIITKSDISKKIVAIDIWDGENILPHVEELYNTVPENAKELVNRFIGNMNKKKAIADRRGVITCSLFDVDILTQFYKQDGYKPYAVEIDDNLYQISAYKHKIHPENKTLIYKGITEGRFVKIMKMVKAVLGFLPKTKQGLIDNGVYAIKTDNVVFSNQHKEKIQYIVDNQVKPHPIFGYVRIEEVKKDLKKSSKAIAKDILEEKHTDNLTWKNDKVFEEHPTVEYLAELQGAFIQGLSGSGKSHCLKLLAEYCEKRDYDVKTLAHTNTAADNIQGQTIYKLLGINTITKKANERKLRRLVRKNTIFIIDEVSLLTSHIFNILKDIKLSHGDKVKFYIAGDFKQCPAVEKNADKIDYENNNILKELTAGNRIVLKTQYRSNAEFVQKCADKNFEDIKRVKTSQTRINICQTHKMRKQINEKMMSKESVDKECVHISMETLDYDKIIDGMITSSKKADGEKGLETDVDKDFIQSLFDKSDSCCYCKRTWACGDRKPTLERINNKIGHVKSNCILACRCCNETRGNKYTHEQFKTYISDDIRKTEDDRQEMWVYEGLPLIARKNYQQQIL